MNQPVPENTTEHPAESTPAHVQNNGAPSSVSETQKRRSRWPFWVALLIVCILFGNWLVPKIIIAFDWFATFQLQLIALAGVMVVLLFWRKQTKLGLLVLCLLAWPLANLISFYIPAEQPKAETRSIRLMTFNVLYPSERYQETLDLIREEDPDIVGLVEFDGHWKKAFADKLTHYPYRVGPYRDCIIYSKLPLEQMTQAAEVSQAWPLPGIYATFRVDDQPVYFMLVHTTSPKSVTDMAERNAQINGIQRYLGFASAYWHVVLAGDFNATTQSHALQTLLDKTEFRDSRQGFGLQHSWPTWFWPISICIDHCFVSEGVVVENRRTNPSIGSDHLPVISDLSFSKHGRK